ncbi:MAG TPA: pantoate--beta-alanine ligase [Candidatus Dormibacteraeota bacterium]|nr:pantoate--beta-alanine ligase [Candidatus Dormibacteraeota bacterium]
MKVIRSVHELQNELSNIKDQTIGYVPTMGFFHEGHLSLMKTAREETDFVVVSIFVNPLQFGPHEDFEQYPRDEERDLKLAKENGVDLVFLPDVSDMYPNEASITMQVVRRTDVLCGRSRPGHFDGVVTVLTKLFHMIQPDQVYFGMKDAQQVAVVHGLITDLNFPITLVGLPTIREENGLAKSSRNVHLSEEEIFEAQWLNRALTRGFQFVVDGEKDPNIIMNKVSQTIKQQTDGKIDYVELLSYPALQEITTINEQVILAVAVQFKHARLIDNLVFDQHGQIIERLR